MAMTHMHTPCSGDKISDVDLAFPLRTTICRERKRERDHLEMEAILFHLKSIQRERKKPTQRVKQRLTKERKKAENIYILADAPLRLATFTGRPAGSGRCRRPALAAGSPREGGMEKPGHACYRLE